MDEEWKGLQETTILEVVLDDNIGDSIEDKLDISCVSGTGEMGVDFLGILHGIQFFKLDLYVGSSFFIRIASSVFGKANTQRRFANLLRKQILLVEE